MLFSDRLNPGDVVAVGDVHGRYDLFSEFLNWVRGSGARVIMLGDLIDRGPDDVAVLHAAKGFYEDPSSLGVAGFQVLRGNHEDMLIRASKGRRDDVSLWLQNGGNIDEMQTLFGYAPWLESLPMWVRVGDTLFVHGGIRPGVAMTEQDPDDLIWIRNPFLNAPDLKLGQVFPDDSVRRVVHGHSPIRAIDDGSTMPEVTRQRVNLDTGAYFTGVLTAFNATTNRFWAFEDEAAKLLVTNG